MNMFTGSTPQLVPPHMVACFVQGYVWVFWALSQHSYWQWLMSFSWVESSKSRCVWHHRTLKSIRLDVTLFFQGSKQTHVLKTEIFWCKWIGRLCFRYNQLFNWHLCNNQPIIIKYLFDERCQIYLIKHVLHLVLG